MPAALPARRSGRAGARRAPAVRAAGTRAGALLASRQACAALNSAADVVVLLHREELAGAMFTVAHGDTPLDPRASSLRRIFASCPSYVLYWEAVPCAIALGPRRLDVGRCPSNSSTYRFKEQWGAGLVPLFSQHALGRAGRIPTLESQRGGYTPAVRLRKRLPLPLARVLGERAKRRFPEVLFRPPARPEEEDWFEDQRTRPPAPVRT